MKAIAIVLCGLMLSATGLVHIAAANGAGDESAFTLHLDAAGQPNLYIKCQFGRDISNCPGPSVWEESNMLRGLQTGGSAGDGGGIGADLPLTP